MCNALASLIEEIVFTRIVATGLTHDRVIVSVHLAEASMRLLASLSKLRLEEHVLSLADLTRVLQVMQHETVRRVLLTMWIVQIHLGVFDLVSDKGLLDH
jgi:hypothetical protein